MKFVFFQKSRKMYKNIKDNTENKIDEKDEKVIIRLKRKVEETTIPSIYVKKSNKRICNGIFYKHIDTIFPEEDTDKKNVDCINLFLKYEQLNCNAYTQFLEKKRKFNSLKNYEKDLKGTINSLKKFKIVNQNIQYVNLDGEKKGTFKIIDIDLHKNINDNIESVEKEKNKEGKYMKEQDYEYDLYILDNEKLQLDNYMDYLYNIKNNNVDPSEVVVLEDIYGSNSEEYEMYSYTSSFDSNSKKEMSDYPDESSCNRNDTSECSDYFDENIYNDDYDKNENIYNDDYDKNENIYNDDYDKNVNSDDRDQNMNNDNHDYITYSDNFNDSNCSDDYNESINSDKCNMNVSDNGEQGNFRNIESYIHKNNPLEYNIYKHNFKKKNENKISTYNIKMNSLSFEEKIKDELKKRLKKKNGNLLNVALSDKLKILEQMENEYYNE
ncbi:conserved Plasmodium protein, unknown function [Plasmodium gallinaceum]|uniref:Uncharacterized protein n=1 Tax=Plasmodium gallinaceum TaxID=5849 RepID=A0A1J1GZX6_PLAGA|nr:conserved Plasmodium protein, unknown function [Plasmodium gallinaceum]CRG97745.1 conserved Plasmodium protein, unknown function [Plasmodium gallinaceum]